MPEPYDRQLVRREDRDEGGYSERRRQVGRRGWMEGSKVVRLWRGGGWPEVSRWSRGRCRGSNKLPPQTSFHVTTLTSLYGYRGQPCNLINCHERTTMLPETSPGTWENILAIKFLCSIIHFGFTALKIYSSSKTRRDFTLNPQLLFTKKRNVFAFIWNFLNKVHESSSKSAILSAIGTLRFHFYVNHTIISRLRKISRKIALVVSSGWKPAFDEATGA